MRYLLGPVFLLAMGLSVGQAETVNGWLVGGFGGYAYVPSYALGTVYTNIGYKSGYNIGGLVGFQNNAARYVGELLYLNAKLKKFKVNQVQQTNVSGGANATVALVNFYYDFHGLLPYTKPFIGGGIGYGWLNNSLKSLESAPNNDSGQGFAYQAGLGFDFDLSNKTTVSLSYRYLVTTQSDALNGSLRPYIQAFLLNLGFLYRFDGCLVKCS